MASAGAFRSLELRRRTLLRFGRMNDTQRNFYLRVASALAGCQLVEQELKLYISEALELIAKQVGNALPFKMRGEDYDDASLERLIDVFRKLSDAPDLCAQLRAFKTERNFLSHAAIALCTDPDGELDNARASELERRLDAHRARGATPQGGHPQRGKQVPWTPLV